MTNKRYKDLKVTPGTYVPPVTLDYPEDEPYVGLYKPVYDREFPAVDANYPYVDDSFRSRLRMGWGYFFVLRLLSVVLRIKYGLRWKMEGDKHWSRCSWRMRWRLRKYHLDRGAITIANHCYRHDAASVLSAIHEGPTISADGRRNTYSRSGGWTECDESVQCGVRRI